MVGEKKPLRDWVYTILLTASLIAVWWLQQSLLRLELPTFGAAVGLIALALGIVALPQPWTSQKAPLARLGLCIGIVVALFFRLRYLDSVPSGWGFEVLTFIYFARDLVDKGFPYIPYAWYAHTLHSYAIAVALLLCGDELRALRLAACTISISTCAMFYLTARWMFGRQTAWITLVVAGSSWWHLWASRNGYHQFLMPLFQLALLGGLVAGFRDGKRWGFALATIALVGGLHAYWGLYLLLPYIALLGLYLLLLQRPLWKAQWRPALIFTGVALLLLMPLILFFWRQPQLFGYITGGFAPAKSDAATFLQKIGNNAWYIFWALSGHAQARVQYASVLDPLVASSSIVGLILSLRWSRRSLAHAAVVLLFLVNVAGLLIAVVNYFYIIATMASVFLFSAIAWDAALGAWTRRFPRLGSLGTLLLLGLLLWQAGQNYHTFFFARATTDLQSPLRPRGQAYVLLDELSSVVQSHTVFLPRYEPGRDFDEEIFEIGKRISTYSFMEHVREFDAITTILPQALLESGQGIEIYLPHAEYVQLYTLPILQRLYPHLRVENRLKPEPFHSLDPAPIALRLSIPWSDAVQRFGLRQTSDDPSWIEGYFVAPADGRYKFRIPPGIPLLIHGAAADQQPILLERGPHPVRMAASPEDLVFAEFQQGGGEWQPLPPRLVNAGEIPGVDFAPYLAHPGKTADFYFEFARRISVPPTIRDAVPIEAGGVAAISVDDTTAIGPGGETWWRWAVPGPNDYQGVTIGEGLYLAEPGGMVLEVDDLSGPRSMDRFTCPFLDFFVQNAELMALCERGMFLSLGQEGNVHPLAGPDGRRLLNPISAAANDSRIWLIDAGASQLLAYDGAGQLLARRIVPNLWGGSKVRFDHEGNLYVRRWKHGWRAYSPDGNLLFHPFTQEPILFSDTAMQPVGNLYAHTLHVRGTQAVFSCMDGYIDNYIRRSIDCRPPAPRVASGWDGSGD